MSWTERAACKTRKDIEFVPVYEGAITAEWKANAAAAKAVCASCPVKADCLADALAHWGTAGIWGGTTEKEREGMVKPRIRVAVAACGTDAGYYRHLRYSHTPACAECLQAHSAASSRRTAKRRAKAVA